MWICSNLYAELENTAFHVKFMVVLFLFEDIVIDLCSRRAKKHGLLKASVLKGLRHGSLILRQFLARVHAFVFLLFLHEKKVTLFVGLLDRP